MQRVLFLLVCVLGAVALLSTEAWGASNDWPPLQGPFPRGPGGYLSIWKLGLTFLLVAAWVRTTDWINRDAQTKNLGFALWNSIAFFSFFIALLLMLLLGYFWIGFLLLVVAYIGPLAAYMAKSYQKDHPGKSPFTPAALKEMLLGDRFEGKESVDKRDRGPDLQLVPTVGANERENGALLIGARNAPGFVPARELIFEALEQRASHIMFDLGAAGVGVRYQVDGVWYDRESLDLDDGTAVLTVLKGVAGLKTEERKARQTGGFAIEAAKVKYNCRLTCQGSPTGERSLLLIDPKVPPFKSAEELGMRPKMAEQLMALLNQQEGLVVFTSMPGGGMSTTFNVLVTQLDRFVRNFVLICEQDKVERDIENVGVTTYNAAKNDTPGTVLPKLLRTYPDVVCVLDGINQETMLTLLEQVEEKHMVLAGIRAQEAVEALLRFLLLKIKPADFAGAVTAVINVRLVRKLCDKCKEAYPPPPEVLKQLGLPAGKVESLYRPPSGTTGSKKVCDKCQGVGYLGRTGIFELLVVDSEMKKALVTAPKLENLRAVARKSKQRSLQDEGVLLVAKGVTSLQELLRVLKPKH